MALAQPVHGKTFHTAETPDFANDHVRRGNRDVLRLTTRLDQSVTPLGRKSVTRAVIRVRPDIARVNRVPALRQAKNLVAGRPVNASDHIVQFYESDAFLVEAVATFVGAAFRAGDAAVVVATGPHRMDLEERLLSAGFDVEAARASGQYISIDASEVLARFMVDGMPDPARFTEVFSTVITQAAAGGRRVRGFGEMVALLAIAGQHAATVCLEELWNDLQRTQPIKILCAYPIDQLGDALLGEICSLHSHVFPAESYSSLPSVGDQLRAVAVLQQKARRLEAEIAAREGMEERLRETLQTEQIARMDAERALHVRDEFLAIAAHELKTPAGVLSIQAQMLLRRFQRHGFANPDGFTSALKSINGQATNLALFIDRLLDVSLLDAGKLRLEPQAVDLVDLLAPVVDNARAMTNQRVIELKAPAMLVARVDRVRVEQVLVNLVDNAIKYSPDGSAVEVTLSQPNSTVAEIAVRDFGHGIPVREREQMFNRFFQGSGNEFRWGLGLGLFLSRQIVELHGGEIHAEFPDDDGTRIVVRLPLTQEEPDFSRIDNRIAVLPG